MQTLNSGQSQLPAEDQVWKGSLNFKTKHCRPGWIREFFLLLLPVMGLEYHKASLIVFQKERKIFLSECLRWLLKNLIQKTCHIFSHCLTRALQVKFWHAVSFCFWNNSVYFTCLLLKRLIILNAISLTYTRRENAFFFKLYQNVILLEKGISSLATLWNLKAQFQRRY